MTKTPILIVEDDVTIQSLLLAVLGKDYDVTIVGNGRDALEQASTILPDLILLDVGLPDIDGLTLCRKFKEDSRLAPVPVIFLTGHTSVQDEVNGLEAGGIDYISKPINPASLRARVKNHIELKQNRDALERLARLDGLTGLPNRRTFDAASTREWRRLARTGESLSVVLMDVDHFKQYNDSYGHGAGDECLRQISRAAQGALQRPADMIARYGGEEFVALLPITMLEGAIGVAEGIRTAVALLQIPHAKSSAAPHVTISLGVASIIPWADKTIDMLLEAADEQLYRAKGDGRNRVKGITLSGPLI